MSDFDIVENKKAKSSIWQYFGLKRQNGELVVNTAVCKICKMCVKYSGGTSNLGSHMNAHHPSKSSISTDKLRQPTDKFRQPSEESSDQKPIKVIKNVTGTSSTQSSIPMLLASKTKYAANSDKAKTITSTVTNFLIHDMRPFRTVETPWFKKMVAALDPRYSHPRSQTVLVDSDPSKICRSAGDCEIAITTDGWTSRATESYITVTSTHINEKWEMKNYVLMTRAMPDSHTGQNIADFLKEALVEWGIPQTPLYLVSDNAANMKRAGEILQCELHLGCFAHVLNLAAQKGLKVKGVSAILARVRHIVAFFHRSTTAAALLKVKASNLDLPNHKLIIDVATRWNSAYDMLERYLEMQAAVVAALLSGELAHKDKNMKFLQDDGITLATKVTECLKPLKQATTMLCSEKSPTVSIIIPLYNKLCNVYMNVSDNDLPAIASMKAAIADDLKGRYDKSHNILLKATALDPRFKVLAHLDDQKRFEVYNDLTTDLAKLSRPVAVVQVKQEPGTLGTNAVTNQGATPELPALPGTLQKSFDTSPVAKKPKLESSALSDLLGDVYVTKVEEAVSPLKQADIEIHKYQELSSVPLSEDPLKWWRDNQGHFPLLSYLARKMLCIPSTSVPSERVFSTAGDIISDQRASLKPKRVDQLIFLKKNMDA
ncbi:E3 SUMO-protein ligase ZBED1-like [Mercenaria mercenaria]|uniref:E3 SUMO-protein ligase ZBED1-like n=1 Tax=Mercenaria mercenaria TaxID=6596 RepID=UPI00234EB086|nr:E3 SUMO-protein ligase ZBED1-like [Mercenaria mercenaria]